MKIFNGITVSNGIGIGKVILYSNIEFPKEEKYYENDIKIKDEIQKFNKTIDTSKKQLELLKKKINVDKKTLEIFDAHIIILNDPEYVEEIKKYIVCKKLTVGSSIKKVTEKFYNIFTSMDDCYFKERADDILDIGLRLYSNYLNIPLISDDQLNENFILVSDVLYPSQSMILSSKYLKGMITKKGGKTSHISILAKNMNIPYIILNDVNFFNYLNNNNKIIIDGDKQKVILDPDNFNSEYYNNVYSKKLDEYNTLKFFKNKECLTKDNKKINLSLAIENHDDYIKIRENNLLGIGLYRTEFLYMLKNTLPTEKEHYDIYKLILENSKNLPVTIRTLDIGGDKIVPSLNISEENNSFLGNRGIRLSLSKHIDIFKIQIRALLKSSVYGNLNILLPMISTIEELLEAKKIINEVRKDLLLQGISINNYKLGIMIEVPSAAIASDLLIKEVDFFSIGTNDLIGYTLAVDRTNTELMHLYDFCNISIIRMIKKIIDIAKENYKKVSICGESASNINLSPLLLGMGADELVVSETSSLYIKKMMKNISYIEMNNLYDNINKLKNQKEIYEVLNKFNDKKLFKN